MSFESVNKWVADASAWAAIGSLFSATIFCLVPAWRGHVEEGATIGGLVGMLLRAIAPIFHTDHTPDTDEALLICLARAGRLFVENEIDIEEYHLMRWLCINRH